MIILNILFTFACLLLNILNEFVFLVSVHRAQRSHV